MAKQPQMALLIAGLVAAALAAPVAHGQPPAGDELPPQAYEPPSLTPPIPASPPLEPNNPVNWMSRVDEAFGRFLVAPLSAVLFFDLGRLLPLELETQLPLIVIWLLVGAIYFTIRMSFVCFWGFGHAVRLTRGDYDDPDNPGEVSHFQALASALSATVGLGNIAGVAIAVSIGGPGAVFWMVVAGFLGMSSKFTECTLGQLYRRVEPDGTISGGPMHYLREGLRERFPALGPVGGLLAVLFAVMCIGGAFGGGCAFQVNQSGNTLLAVWQLDDARRLTQLDEQMAAATSTGENAALPALREERAALSERLSRAGDIFKPIYGLVMMAAVGIVIIGGIRRIAATAEKVVPLMCALYVLSSLAIMVIYFDRLDDALFKIVNEAFARQSFYGGLLGSLIVGVQRAAFSNEAGIGSASIAHAAAKTKEPLSEGFVSLLEPFIDTVIICTMTGLVIVVTGVYDSPATAELVARRNGAALTAVAFENAHRWLPYLLAVATLLFAYATMISWGYYGERCWSQLFGRRSSIVYKVLFLAFIFLGAIATAQNILDFSDLMILSMALPNILGCVLLSGVVRTAMLDYWSRLKSGHLRNARHS